METTCDTRQLLLRRTFVVAACRVIAVVVLFHAVLDTLYLDLFEYLLELRQSKAGFLWLEDVMVIMLKALYSGVVWAVALWLLPKYVMRFMFPLGKGKS